MAEVFVSYSWQLATEFMAAGAGLANCTVGQFNSALAMASSIRDMLAQPEILAPSGATRLKYPEVTYAGPIEEYNGKRVPVVGGLAAPREWYTTQDNAQLPSADRRVLWDGLGESMRLLSWESPAPTAPGGTRPAGLVLGTQYPAGVIGMEGIGAQCALPYDDPAFTLTVTDEGRRFAAMLALALPAADALTARSAAGQPIVGVVGEAAVRNLAALQLALVYDEMAKADRKRKTKIAVYAGGGIVLLALTVRMLTKQRKGRDGAVQLGAGR